MATLRVLIFLFNVLEIARPTNPALQKLGVGLHPFVGMSIFH